MPANKNALIRYKTIDNCLRNKYRRWTLEDLVDACSDALYDLEGISKGVSLRTVQGDIQMMRLVNYLAKGFSTLLFVLHLAFQLQIFQRKVSVFIQRLPMGQTYFPSFRSFDTKFHISGYILAKVKNKGSIRRMKNSRREAFLLDDFFSQSRHQTAFIIRL